MPKNAIIAYLYQDGAGPRKLRNKARGTETGFISSSKVLIICVHVINRKDLKVNYSSRRATLNDTKIKRIGEAESEALGLRSLSIDQKIGRLGLIQRKWLPNDHNFHNFVTPS